MKPILILRLRGDPVRPHSGAADEKHLHRNRAFIDRHSADRSFCIAETAERTRDYRRTAEKRIFRCCSVFNEEETRQTEYTQTVQEILEKCLVEAARSTPPVITLKMLTRTLLETPNNVASGC